MPKKLGEKRVVISKDDYDNIKDCIKESDLNIRKFVAIAIKHEIERRKRNDIYS